MFPQAANSPLNNPLTRALAGSNLAFGRLACDGNHVLEYHAAYGTFIEVNGSIVDISTALTNNIAGDQLINADGEENGFTPSASTLYYAYVSNAAAIDAPSSLRLSASAPDVATAGLWAGIPYLTAPGPTTSNGQNWRYVGSVYIDASVQVTDTVTARHVANYYNRLPRSIYVAPQYSNNNAQTTYAFNSATFAIVAADALATFVTPIGFNTTDRAEPTLFANASFVFSARGAAAGAYGISVDSTTSPTVARSTAALSTAGLAVSIAWTDSLGAEGLHTVRMLGMSGGVADTIVADLARNGSASDPAATVLTGWVLS